RVDDSYLLGFADAVAGELGGKVDIAPRLFLGKLVDVMDRGDQNPDFDPRRHYSLPVAGGELTETDAGAHVQRAAHAAEVELDLGAGSRQDRTPLGPAAWSCSTPP